MNHSKSVLSTPLKPNLDFPLKTQLYGFSLHEYIIIFKIYLKNYIYYPNFLL